MQKLQVPEVMYFESFQGKLNNAGNYLELQESTHLRPPSGVYLFYAVSNEIPAVLSVTDSAMYFIRDHDGHSGTNTFICTNN